ncbi:MAG: nicotinate-nucleotide--dimethylbenzimidazole phosphoribosyltransferase [Acidobacteriota bacterium]|nr:nicotinate-nucleotide--dimethylbenzimidazole phosphoribosyltransferase [Acidobacteriota bacterium]
MNAETRQMVADIASSMEEPSETWARRARTHLDSLTKPPGSLGRLEDIAAQLVSIRQEHFAEPLRKAVYVFAADHGVTAEGVSAYPSEVTRQMVLNFLRGGAAVNVLAKLHGVDVRVVDVGVDADFAGVEGLLHRKVCLGTRNMLHDAAMSEDEMRHAIAIGVELAREAKAERYALIGAGEMGIGNTTAASAITALLTRKSVALVTGKGTGLGATALARKQEVIQAAIQKHFPAWTGEVTADPLEVLRCVGGLEIAAMVGLVLGAAREGIAIVADGFISTAAAAMAYAVEPRVKAYLLAGHLSEEPGHQALLDFVGLQPILTLGMRLGEGSGAVLAMPAIDAAMAIYNQMATFASAGVSEANS